MKSLYYENLNDAQLSRMQNFLPSRLRVIRDYLWVSKDHLKSQSLELGWNTGIKPENPEEHPDEGVWISIAGIENDLSESQLKTLFETGNIRDIYEKDTDETLSSIRYHKGNSIKVLSQDRDTEQLLLDREPVSGHSLVVRPNTYALEKQMEAVLQLQNRPSEALKPLLRLFDRVDKTRWPNSSPVYNDLEWRFLTDKERPGAMEQREFVHKAIATPDFALLEGPPGSGKTTVICELISQALKEDQRILLCASTHVAIDNVLERLLADTEKAQDIIPVRIGDESNVSESVRPYTLKNFMRSERERIRKYINTLDSPSKIQTEWSKLLGQKTGQMDELQMMILNSANLICGTTVGILQHPEIKENNRRTEPLYDLLIIDEASKTTFQEFLVPAVLAKKWILVGDPQQLSPYVDSDELAANLKQLLPETERNAALDTYNAKQNGRMYRSTLVQSTEKEKEKAAEIYRNFTNDNEITIMDSLDDDLELADVVILTRDEIESKRQNLPLDLATLRKVNNERVNNQAKAWNKQRHEFAPKWEDEIAWRILSQYELRMTEDSKGTERIRSVIENLIPETEKKALKRDIDGLSRIAIPSILECLQNGISRDCKEDETKYDGTFLTDGFPEYAKAPRYTLLKYQHRMHPQISDFCRQNIYSGQALLDPDFMESSRYLPNPLYPYRSQWIHIKNGYSYGNKNHNEAKQIICEIKKLGDWKQTSSSEVKTVAILTFYRGQERLLRTYLRQLTNNNKSFRHFKYKGLNIDLCTVDRFQGHEADFVYLSFVNRRATHFLQSSNRLNVALTRAKFQLVIVGNRIAFEKSSDSSILYKLCKYHSDKTEFPFGENK